jgi:hypothetical protein
MGKEEGDDMGAPTKKSGMTRFKAQTILCNTANKIQHRRPHKTSRTRYF